MIPIWTQKFYSARTVGNKATQYLYANCIYSDILNTIDLTTLSTIGRKYSAVKKTRIQNLQGSLQRKVSLALISLNMSTTKKIIEWTVLAVLIGKTISTENDMVKSNKVIFVSYISNFFFSIYILFAYECM